MLAPTSTVEEATGRMGATRKALREIADTEIDLGKTKVMHAQDTIHVEKPTAVDYSTDEVKKLLTEKCEACGACFTAVRGLNVHLCTNANSVICAGGWTGQSMKWTRW